MKLTKKQYLGVGYINTYINNSTKEILNVECTESEYNDMENGIIARPTIENYSWCSSSGGIIKCNNNDYILHEGEYCDYENEYFLIARNINGDLIGKIVNKDLIINDEIDINNI